MHVEKVEAAGFVPADTRRVRRWVMDPTELLGYLQQLFNPNGIRAYRFFKCAGLPDGFTVLFHTEVIDPYRIAFYIHHPSFTPVPVGERIPDWRPAGDLSFLMETVPYPPAREPDPVPVTARGRSET